MSVEPPIDWEQLAKRLGTLKDNGESGGRKFARQAIEEIIGASEWRAAVDYYVSCKPGAELARSVLWLIHPWAAMERCHEIACDPEEESDRRSDAVNLLQVAGDRRALKWVRGYLADSDAGVQIWGAGIVDQLLWSELVEPGECAELLVEMSRHPNPAVREKVEWIHSFLQNRAAQSKSDESHESPQTRD